VPAHFCGRLGVLAGDHLKASSDLGLPDHLHVLLQGISLNTDLLNTKPLADFPRATLNALANLLLRPRST
jgi:hypothetical protein